MVEESNYMQESPNTHLIIIFLLLVTIINLFILDLKVFNPAANVLISDITTSNISPTISTTNTSTSLGVNYQPLINDNNSCPIACLSIIQQATISASQSSLQGHPLQIALEQSREYYIPLGNGNTSKTTWEDITGTDTTIDPSNYGSIKEVYFIASLKNPTQNGQMEAQLYNVTDKHPVWNSLVILNGPLTQTITSHQITLDRGNKLYRVQLKSSLGYSVSLENAKIKIISNE